MANGLESHCAMVTAVGPRPVNAFIMMIWFGVVAMQPVVALFVHSLLALDGLEKHGVVVIVSGPIVG
eukprot:CAMPEP_0178842842 /NCGR_PEP_ID=MMETSP0746-20121128/15769_1 /TAXON_ID=913974 /ORGANISM="Nitzschia punctata, Strain CCMP561" /LENGTH=66 /DNA_ID=CAMNT_0020506297 /DNA_START=67 /DNA_END=263 /DNA_ORIENTATION=-